MNFPGAAAAIKAFTEAATGDTVDADEVIRRTNICMRCPQRRNVNSLGGVISQKLGLIANRNKVPRPLQRHACGACGCSLMLLVPSKTLHPDKPEQLEKRPATCWVLTPRQAADKLKAAEDAAKDCKSCG